jgi:uncharacterized iron-regulated membrane protein
VLHLWVGLAAGLLLSVMGLSGSALIFRSELEPRLRPNLLRVTPRSERASWQAILANARRAAPEATILYVFTAPDAKSSHAVWLKDGRRVYVDPYSARVLGTGRAEEGLFGFLSELHIRLLSGETGHTVIGVAGLMLIVLALTGLAVWWPRRTVVARESFWQRGFRVHWEKNGKVITYDLHRVAGALVAVSLIVIATCGASLVFAEPATAIVYRLLGGAPPGKVKAGSGTTTGVLPLDALVNRGQAALPGARLTRISFPTKSGAPLALRFRQPGEWHPNGMTSVYLDSHNGNVLRVDDATRASAAQRILNLRYPVHIGVWGGTWSQMLHVVLGLMPAFLFVSGLLIWLGKQRGKARNRARHR